MTEHSVNEGGMTAMQITTGNATVRIHGNPDRERIEAATLIFLKAAEQQRKRDRKNGKKQ